MSIKLKFHKGIFRIKNITHKYRNSIKSFGFIPSTKIFIGDFIIILITHNIIPSKKIAKLFFDKRHSLIKNSIISKYGDIIKKELDSQSRCLQKNEGPIWFCWLQGESEMPKYVKFCYESIKRNGTREVNLITISNYTKYIQLPDYIIEKVDKGLFSYTFFADILRVNLLYKYGGLWSDSRILLTQPINQNYFDYEFFTIKNHPKSNQFVSNYRWTVGFMACTPKSPIFGVLKNFFAEYVKREDFLVDYFLMDYIIAIAYECNTEIKQLIDKIPCTNDYFFFLTDEKIDSKQTLFTSINKNSIFLLPKLSDNSFEQAIKDNKGPLSQIFHSVK